MEAPSRVRAALNQSALLENTKLTDMNKATLATFTREDKLKENSARRFRKHIFSTAVDPIDKPDRYWRGPTVHINKSIADGAPGEG